MSALDDSVSDSVVPNVAGSFLRAITELITDARMYGRVPYMKRAWVAPSRGDGRAGWRRASLFLSSHLP